MIQKLQTFLIRFIGWLEDNSETRLIKAILSVNEDVHLSKLYKELNRTKSSLLSSIDAVNKMNSEYESLIDQSLSHIKRKDKILKLPPIEGESDTHTELKVSSVKEQVIVATRLAKILELSRKKNNNVRPELIAMESTTLCQLVLNASKDIPTVEGSLIRIEEKIHV